MKIWRFMKCLDHCILKSVKHKRTTVICFPFLSTCDLVCGGRVRITSRSSGRTIYSTRIKNNHWHKCSDISDHIYHHWLQLLNWACNILHLSTSKRSSTQVLVTSSCRCNGAGIPASEEWFRLCRDVCWSYKAAIWQSRLWIPTSDLEILFGVIIH